MKYTLFFSQIQFDFLPNSELLIIFWIPFEWFHKILIIKSISN